MDKYEYNTFIIGAGFSVPAGLPLGNDLMKLVIEEAKKIPIGKGQKETLFDTIINPDIEDYIWYKELCGLKINDVDCINMEDFISYLDLEHYLGLLGKNNWSKEGNRSQILIRNLISKIIYDRQLKVRGQTIKLYDDFVKKLKPYDLILTFNYDTIIETYLERNKIPFRYHWSIYKDIDAKGEVTLNSDDEAIILLKVHGSIDWFSRDGFDRSLEYVTRQGHPEYAFHTVFKNPHIYLPTPIIKGKIHPKDPMKNIFRCNYMERYFKDYEPVKESPLIISPSSNKLLYMQQLRELWDGFYGTAMFSKNFTIIGFSLPQHDEYIRLPLYRAIYNFQYSETNPGYERNKLKVIDFKKTTGDQNAFKSNYSILDESKTDFYFEGFEENIVRKLLENI